MTATGGRWDDLALRLASALGLGALGLAAVWIGGVWFAALVATIVGVMVWELARMVAPQLATAAVALGVLAGLALFAARPAPAEAVACLLVAPAVAGFFALRRAPAIFAAAALVLALAGYGLTVFRDAHGSVWLIWLVLVVTATDVFGYFIGRLVGGPKFFPSLSPKKTWSGAAAGWIAAAAIGLGFLAFTTAGRDLVWISAGLSLASQIGDVTESALKRHLGVKDTSSLMPGHGGMCDRFDGLLGAALVMLAVAQLTPVPVVAI